MPEVRTCQIILTPLTDVSSTGFTRPPGCTHRRALSFMVSRAKGVSLTSNFAPYADPGTSPHCQCKDELRAHNERMISTVDVDVSRSESSHIQLPFLALAVHTQLLRTRCHRRLELMSKHQR